MPVPKPLPKKASKESKKKRMAEVMTELKSGPHHKERTQAQEIAIAMKSSGQSKKKFAKKTSKKRKTSDV